MSDQKVYRAIGLMSGTSLDGIDAALIETDGQGHVKVLDFAGVPYEEAVRAKIRGALGKAERDEALERDITQAHIDVLKAQGWEADVIGFHGQTIFHAPDEGLTIQLGDGAAMAKALGIDVVNDFRSADVAAGGQGAPLAPLYHYARAKASGIETPAVILNIGGVGNVSYIGESLEDTLAFDTGPGNALLDDWTAKRTGQAFDKDGALAAAGRADQALIDQWMALPYFKAAPPKSLDRDEWDIAGMGPLSAMMKGFSDEAGAATLLEFSAQGIKHAEAFFPAAPKAWYIGGGGRHNTAMMQRLSKILTGDVQPVEALGWNGDAIEAECFAYLAVRSLLEEPFSLPKTTGVPLAQTGGVLHKMT